MADKKKDESRLEAKTSQATDRLLSLVACTGKWGHKVKLARLEDDQRQKVADFDSNMFRIGLDPAEVKKAADLLLEYGMSESLEDSVLEDKEAPLMVSLLALSPKKLKDFEGLSESEMAIQLDELKEFASVLRPRTSQAPDPPNKLVGIKHMLC